MDHLSIEVALFEAMMEENTACYICQELVRCVEISDPMHGVVPARNTRAYTCGHLVHSECASSLYNRYGFLREHEVNEGILLIEWSHKCYCGFIGNTFCSADVSLGKYFIPNLS